MFIAEAVNATNKKECICFVGAGGKTTSMFRLARELASNGNRVLVTTTTKIFHPEGDCCDYVFIGNNSEILDYTSKINIPGIYVLGSEVLSGNKLNGISKELACELYSYNYIDFLLIEADGSKQKPIKAPADFEPVIPDCATKVVGVIGLDAIGQAAEDSTVHRFSEFSKITGCSSGEEIRINHILKLIEHKEGLLKDKKDHMEGYVLLNKADNEVRLAIAKKIKQDLNEGKGMKTLIGCVSSTNPIIE